MEKRIPGILIGAPKSGSGKTLFTCGLLEILKRRGLRPVSCKCGPDYIDPMFHHYVLHTAGINLDLFFSEPEQAKALLSGLIRQEQAGIVVAEGVMGYYDGIGGLSDRASAWETAVKLGFPAVLVLDCKGMSLSAAALVAGYAGFREDSRIGGVILNRISRGMYDRLKTGIEKETGIPVLGYLPESSEFRLESRHLGLFLPGETDRLRERIGMLAEQMEKSVDIDAVLRLAERAELPLPETESSFLSVKEQGTIIRPSAPLRIGIARDEAFCFYYQENMELLKQNGAQLLPFSPLRDEDLPNALDGLILGGGYPENYASRLSENTAMRRAVSTAIRSGLPLLAECGGFLYLHRELEGSDGRGYPMAGVYDSRAYRTGRLGHFGYVFLTSPEGLTIKGHEFHYWESENPGECWLAEKPEAAEEEGDRTNPEIAADGKKPGMVVPGRRKWRCMHGSTRQVAGFPHLYYPSNPEFLAGWLEECRNWREEKIRNAVAGTKGSI